MNEQPQYDFYSLLEQKRFPNEVAIRSRLGFHVIYMLMPIITEYPAFKEWFDSMESEDVSSVLMHEDVPVIGTNYHITRNEVCATTSKFVQSFMVEISHAVINQQITVMEAFSVLLDAICSFQYQATNKLSNVH